MQHLHGIREQGRHTDATQAEVLRMMEKWNVQEARNETLERRIRRLEDDALRQAG